MSTKSTPRQPTSPVQQTSVHTIPAARLRRTNPLPPLPPAMPLTPMVPARVLTEAERRLEELSQEVLELKRRDDEREAQLQITRRNEALALQAEYEQERKDMIEETHNAYLFQRDQMYKKLQMAFLDHQRRIEQAKREYLTRLDGEEASDDDERVRRTLKKGQVLVATTEQVNGYQIVGSSGWIKAAIPRSYERLHAVSGEEGVEELARAKRLAQIVRQEVFEKLIAVAKKRGANAAVQFDFGSQIREDNDGDTGAVLIMARGLAVTIRPMPSQRERVKRQRLLEAGQRQRTQMVVNAIRQYMRNPPENASSHNPRDSWFAGNGSGQLRDILRNISASQNPSAGNYEAFYDMSAKRKDKGRHKKMQDMDGGSRQNQLLKAFRGQLALTDLQYDWEEEAGTSDDEDDDGETAPTAGASKAAEDGFDFKWESV